MSWEVLLKWRIISETVKVGPSSTPSSTSSLFYFSYYINTSSSSDYIHFSVPGLPENKILRSLSTTSYRRFKVEHRLSGNSCLTIIHEGGTEIYNKIHDCGAYTTGDTHIHAGGYHSSNNQAIGWVDTFNFVWL